MNAVDSWSYWSTSYLMVNASLSSSISDCRSKLVFIKVLILMSLSAAWSSISIFSDWIYSRSLCRLKLYSSSLFLCSSVCCLILWIDSLSCLRSCCWSQTCYWSWSLWDLISAMRVSSWACFAIRLSFFERLMFKESFSMVNSSIYFYISSMVSYISFFSYLASSLASYSFFSYYECVSITFSTSFYISFLCSWALLS